MSNNVMGLAGPVDIAVLGFDGSVPTDAIMAAVADAIEAGQVRVLDALVVERDAEGNIDVIDVDNEDEALAVLGFPADVPGLLGAEDVAMIAQQLTPSSSAVVIVWENSWAAHIATAVRDAGGQLLVQERIPREDVQLVLDAFS